MGQDLSAQVAGDYLRKGGKVAIVGRLEIEQWTDRSSGEVRSKTLVVIDRLELCGGRNGTQQIDGAADLAAFSPGQSVSGSTSQTPTAAAGGSRSPSATTWGAPTGAPTPAAPAWSTNGPISDEGRTRRPITTTVRVSTLQQLLWLLLLVLALQLSTILLVIAGPMPPRLLPALRKGHTYLDRNGDGIACKSLRKR